MYLVNNVLENQIWAVPLLYVAPVQPSPAQAGGTLVLCMCCMCGVTPMSDISTYLLWRRHVSRVTCHTVLCCCSGGLRVRGGGGGGALRPPARLRAALSAAQHRHPRRRGRRAQPRGRPRVQPPRRPARPGEAGSRGQADLESVVEVKTKVAEEYAKFHNHGLLRLRPNFTSTYLGVNARLAWCLNSVLNVKALVSAFNQEKGIVGAFFMIVKL